MDTTTQAAQATRAGGTKYAGSGDYTAKITVHARCTCNAARWFLCVPACPGRDVLAVFEGEGYEESPAAPLPYFVAQVRAQYPRADLIYLD